MREVYIPEELELHDYEVGAVEQAIRFVDTYPALSSRYDTVSGARREAVHGGVYFNPEDADQLTIVGMSPFANNFPHNFVRDTATAQALNVLRSDANVGTAAAVHVANNTLSTRAYNYSDSELDSFRAGSFDPIADRILRSFYVSRLRGPILFSGQSQGGSASLAIAEKVAKYYDVVGVASLEPTTFAGHTMGEQQAAFRKGGMEDMNAAVLDSGSRILQEMMAVGDTPSQTMKQIIKTANFAVGTLTKDNRAIKRALAGDAGHEQLRSLDESDIRVVIMSGASSLILPHSVMVDLQDIYKNSENIDIVVSGGGKHLKDKNGNIKPHGHGIGDNIAAVAALAVRVARPV